jgi:hypothetical protein
VFVPVSHPQHAMAHGVIPMTPHGAHDGMPHPCRPDASGIKAVGMTP